MYIDTHAHFDSCIIDANFLEKDLFSAMNRNGISHAVHIATELSSFRWAKDFVSRHDNIYFAAGVHPSSQFYPSDMEDLALEVEQIVSSGLNSKFIALGEIGLDYYHLPNTREQQINYFEKQIEIALNSDKALIIHTRDAFDDTYSVLKSSGAKRVLIHCFSGGPAEAGKMIELGYYISFAGNVTFKKAETLRSALRVVPVERLMFETDCPYLSPEPVRGTKNQPANVKFTYGFASDILECDENVLIKTVKNNFERLFGVELLNE